MKNEREYVVNGEIFYVFDTDEGLWQVDLFVCGQRQHYRNFLSKEHALVHIGAT